MRIPRPRHTRLLAATHELIMVPRARRANRAASWPHRHDLAGRWDILPRRRICGQSTTLPIPASPNARHRTRWNAVHMAALGVLIVDDNWLFMEAARDCLEQEGLRVVGIAVTSAEALRRAEELRPEAVLVDVMLGDESGFELARRLAAHHRD